MQHAEVRETVHRLAREQHVSLAALSRMLRRNAAYLHQFIHKGSPKRLEDKDRALLAAFFQVDEELLGGPRTTSSNMVQVARLAVQASAGPGSLVGDEVQVGTYGFDPAWLQAVSRACPEHLSIIKVMGDSMVPTLIDGDDVLVDRSDRGRALRDGIYVLRRDDTLMVKRLATAPTCATVTISSDNTAYPTWPDCSVESIDVVGRVVWAGRRLG